MTILLDLYVSVSVQQRLEKIEKEKIRVQAIIEKEINVQLSYLPMVYIIKISFLCGVMCMCIWREGG